MHTNPNGSDCIDNLIVLDDLRMNEKKNKEGGDGTYGFMIISAHSPGSCPLFENSAFERKAFSSDLYSKHYFAFSTAC